MPWSAFGSTVRSFRMLLPDGELITCSHGENFDQFKLAMGGYGLTSVITDLDVEMMPNARLRPKFKTMPAKDFGGKFVGALKGNRKIQMAYGRLDVTIGKFFE